MFALFADPRREPPQGRMKKIQHLNHRLHHIEQVIVPPDMGQFVSQNSFYIGHTQTRQQTHRP